jgi:ubiquinol-cytochrome c reductase cytochrome c1 subunit
MRRLTAALLVVLAPSLAPLPALAAGEADAPKSIDWSFNGPFGKFDLPAARRGLKVYLEVCGACHSLRYVAYRNLVELGLTEDEAKAIAASHEVRDGPDETGNYFMRPAGLAERFVPPFANEQAARFANGGAYPPDLSLMYKARPNGANYVYSLLTGYGDAPANVELAPGMNYNPYFAGHRIAMPQPLLDDMVQYDDGTPATLDQLARDAVQFLAWAAEPNLPTRHRMGFGVLIYLVLLTFLLYRVKRQVWRDQH